MSFCYYQELLARIKQALKLASLPIIFLLNKYKNKIHNKTAIEDITLYFQMLSFKTSYFKFLISETLANKFIEKACNQYIPIGFLFYILLEI